jgi:hypothetical protein
MNTHLSIFYLIDLHVIRQETLFRMKLYHHQIYSFVVDDLIAEKGDEASPVRLYQRQTGQS